MERVYRLDNINKFKLFDISNVRWLDDGDLQLINQFLKDCNTSFTFSYSEFSSLKDKGIYYCGLFENKKLTAIACLEKYSYECWDVSDARVIKNERSKGYGKCVASFITKYILEQGKAATCYTKASNLPAQRVINSIGFELLMELENANDYYSQFINRGTAL